MLFLLSLEFGKYLLLSSCCAVDEIAAAMDECAFVAVAAAGTCESEVCLLIFTVSNKMFALLFLCVDATPAVGIEAVCGFCILLPLLLPSICCCGKSHFLLPAAIVLECEMEFCSRNDEAIFWLLGGVAVAVVTVAVTLAIGLVDCLCWLFCRPFDDNGDDELAADNVDIGQSSSTVASFLYVDRLDSGDAFVIETGWIKIGVDKISRSFFGAPEFDASLRFLMDGIVNDGSSELLLAVAPCASGATLFDVLVEATAEPLPKVDCTKFVEFFKSFVKLLVLKESKPFDVDETDGGDADAFSVFALAVVASDLMRKDFVFWPNIMLTLFHLRTQRWEKLSTCALSPTTVSFK